jgi:hypothetical protein
MEASKVAMAFEITQVRQASKRIFLTATEFSHSIVLNLSYPTRFTNTFLEEVMKWACLKYLERCLPEASA